MKNAIIPAVAAVAGGVAGIAGVKLALSARAQDARAHKGDPRSGSQGAAPSPARAEGDVPTAPAGACEEYPLDAAVKVPPNYATAVIRSAPVIHETTKIGLLEPGTRVAVGDVVVMPPGERWIRVRKQDGQEGFMHANVLELPDAYATLGAASSMPSWWPADLPPDHRYNWSSTPAPAPLEVIEKWRRRGVVHYLREIGGQAAEFAEHVLAHQLAETSGRAGSPLKVREGHIPFQIAAHYGGRLAELAALNPGLAANNWAGWQPGKLLLLPPSWLSEVKPYPPRAGGSVALGGGGAS
ncbi:SH3 domain-containing protein [Chondromyces apiculatus]|uniref:LysM domain-containing protein n=1 Tax=Chondromyces apiculatus DSM 436 TaxID=1192034 RepID=A0A017TER9_9BACT|nr:SH3 domain-containing protein [Chondromyces apiculatus]EYF07056.1 Hypothetical protein CAP_1315 [Chondromyces apiculatus DSM 436]